MGLGFKVGKGLGKNDQGITEPVQATNKSKFKENNMNKSSNDYFEKKTTASGGQLPTQKMVKFEKKSTLIINGAGTSPANNANNENVDDENNAAGGEPSPNRNDSGTKEEAKQHLSSNSKNSHMTATAAAAVAAATATSFAG